MQEKFEQEECDKLVSGKRVNLCLMFQFFEFQLVEDNEVIECTNQEAMDGLTKERQARLDIERSQKSLSEELGRAQRELSSANQKVEIE